MRRHTGFGRATVNLQLVLGLSALLLGGLPGLAAAQRGRAVGRPIEIGREREERPGESMRGGARESRSPGEVTRKIWTEVSGFATGWASERRALAGSVLESAHIDDPFVREATNSRLKSPFHGEAWSDYTTNSRKLNPSACVILPDGEESYRKVFPENGNPSESQLNRLDSYRREFLRASAEIVGSKEARIEVFEAKVRAMAADAWPLVVIGHSEFTVAGEQFLRLPSGDPVPIKDIHRWAKEEKTICLVLTCRGRDFGLDEDIGFDDAIAMWNAGNEAMNGFAKKPTPVTQQEVLEFVSGTAKCRWDRNASRTRLTVSLLPSNEGNFAIWELPLERPNRSLLILIISIVGFCMLHYTMWRVGRTTPDSRATTWWAFRLAMIGDFRYRMTKVRLGIQLALFTLLASGIAYIAGSELQMDLRDRHLGMRHIVYFGTALGSVPLILACLIYLTNPINSTIGWLVYGIVGALIGASWAWLLTTLHLLVFGIGIGIFFTLIACIFWIFDQSFNPLLALVSAVLFSGFIGSGLGLLSSIAGFFLGWSAAVAGRLIHKDVTEEIVSNLNEALWSPPCQ